MIFCAELPGEPLRRTIDNRGEKDRLAGTNAVPAGEQAPGQYGIHDDERKGRIVTGKICAGNQPYGMASGMRVAMQRIFKQGSLPVAKLPRPGGHVTRRSIGERDTLPHADTGIGELHPGTVS